MQMLALYYLWFYQYTDRLSMKSKEVCYCWQYFLRFLQCAPTSPLCFSSLQLFFLAILFKLTYGTDLMQRRTRDPRTLVSEG